MGELEPHKSSNTKKYVTYVFVNMVLQIIH
jgi:hypothetical protein